MPTHPRSRQHLAPPHPAAVVVLCIGTSIGHSGSSWHHERLLADCVPPRALSAAATSRQVGLCGEEGPVLVPPCAMRHAQASPWIRHSDAPSSPGSAPYGPRARRRADAAGRGKGGRQLGSTWRDPGSKRRPSRNQPLGLELDLNAAGDDEPDRPRGAGARAPRRPCKRNRRLEL